ncbi:GGDEF domain-containing protein [Terriglobus aquaticus]|uniref:Diguanylate cyclase domain-containing protein n=1 Tax=Terriglobus aquaticus TaxID=940139 RepID=A0ABW9KQY0_9BACT|nr:GGDEF domain-containing protein [Terriglobus aquaticus]
MNSLLLPDLFAMAVLLSVLWLVRRRYPQHDIRLWMSALLLILLESVARILYGMHLPTGPHRALHAIALDAYLLAGMLFLRSSVRGLQRLPRAHLYFVLLTAPGVVLATVYGCDVNSRLVYEATTVAGVVLTAASTIALRRPRRYLVGLIAVWAPATYAAFTHSPRIVTYLLLAGVYLATAVTFGWSLPRSSSGRVAVVVGFVVWGGCFATHPWIASMHPQWVALASEVWNMQKFLITVGLLLILFERQVESNEWLALHDQLTGLPNRRLFEDRLGSAIARAERDGTALILFYMDLNNFKEVNDTLGHDVGDTLLCKVAESLQQVVRRTDTLARMGGDEFVLLATDVQVGNPARKEGRWARLRDSGERRAANPATAAKDGRPSSSPKVASRSDLQVSAEQTLDGDSHSRMVQQALSIEQTIRTAVNRPVKIWSRAGTHTLEASASIGSAMYPMDSTDPDELCRIADQRMYQEKGRDPASRAGLERMLSLLTTK